MRHGNRHYWWGYSKTYSQTVTIPLGPVAGRLLHGFLTAGYYLMMITAGVVMVSCLFRSGR